MKERKKERERKKKERERETERQRERKKEKERVGERWRTISILLEIEYTLHINNPIKNFM